MSDAAPGAPLAAARAGQPPALPRPSPVARFLGDAEAAGGPFAILRLVAGPVGDDQIIDALDTQLARLASHVECNTPQADEVRLALHAAAAQLLDPRIRAHMLARWGAGEGPDPAPDVERRKFPRAGSSHVALEHDAVLTLGMFGGWNRRSLDRLMALSAARGLKPNELADALRGLGGGVQRAVPERPAPGARAAPVLTRLSTPLPAAPPDPNAPQKRMEPLPEQIDPAVRILKYVLLGGAAVLLVLMLGLGAVVLILLRPPPVVVAVSRPPPNAIASTPVAPVPPAAIVPPPPDEAPDLDLVTRELGAAVGGFAADPAGATLRFELAISALAAGWTTLAPDQMVAAQHQVIEFVYRAAPTPQGPRAVEAVAAGSGPLAGSGPIGATDVRAAVWSAGMLNRLAKENDLPSGVEQMIDSRLNAALGARRPTGNQSFEAGAAAAAQAVPRLLLGPGASPGAAPDPARIAATLEGWRRWIDSADHVARDAGSRDRLLLGGLETLLVDGPNPVADEAAFKVVRLIVGRLTWRPGDPSREWLIRWFVDDRVTSGDLYAVTSALATSSSAENVNATMVVPVQASESVRAEMRDAYSKAWGLAGGPDRAATMKKLLEAADEALAADESGRSLSEVLGATVVLSRLNEAASWAWRGHADQAEAILANLQVDIAVGTTTARPKQAAGLMSPDARPDRGWAAKYLGARKNIQLRLDLIAKLAGETQLDAVGAELLAAEAVRGSPAEVRKAAVERVLRFGASPLIVNGLLEELPTMPATIANLQLLETVSLCPLPPPSDPGWMMAARRALVERLLELVASEGELAMIDRQSELLAKSFEGRTLENPRASPTSATPTVSPPAADLSAAILYRQWRSRLDPSLPSPAGLAAPEEIERRRAGRLALSRGMVQSFEAQEVSAAELMAFVVGAEQPADAPRIGSVLADLLKRRQGAGHIFEQIRATEAATLRLWLIRLGQEPQS